MYGLVITILINFIFVSKSYPYYLIEKNKELEEALKAYTYFLEGKSLEQIKRETKIPESIKNSHQALDYVVYLMETSKIEKLLGINDFNSCREDLMDQSKFQVYSRSYHNINYAIKKQYGNEWFYDFPERISCNICLQNIDCKKANTAWKENSSYYKNEFKEKSKIRQKDLCLEMSQYAQTQAKTGSVLEGGDKRDCPKGSICPTKNPFWEILYLYDFKICQEDFLICPTLSNTSTFIHPSCYKKSEDEEKINSKISWLNGMANSILSSCENLPAEFNDLNSSLLISCLEKTENIQQEGYVYINQNDLENLENRASTIQYKLGEKTYEFQSYRFLEIISDMKNKIEEKQLQISQIELKIKQNAEKEYNFTTKEFEYKLSPKSKLNPKDFEALFAQIEKEEEELATLKAERKKIIAEEMDNLPPGVKEGEYHRALKDSKESLKHPLDSYYYFEKSKISSFEIQNDKTYSEFPQNIHDQKTVINFLSQKIKDLINRKNFIKNDSEESINNLSRALAYQCFDQKIRDMGCMEKNFTLSPHCSTCPDHLSQAQLDPQEDEEKVITKEEHRRKFYQERRCQDYLKDYQEIQNENEFTSLKQNICHKKYKIPSKHFSKIHNSMCEI